jgi:small-conductance mechanosensitive channel
MATQITTSPQPIHALHLFGVTFIGATQENAIKLGLSIGWVVLVSVAGRMLQFVVRKLAPDKVGFWSRQGVSILRALLLAGGLVSIWFSQSQHLATAVGLVTAGMAFALQRVITAIAGYLVILRGSTFNIGDRIAMSGVRGDVIALNFMQTTIMEMGETSGQQADARSTWVHARQYTGRIVTVSNAKVFDDPVYNYSRQFKYLWDEIHVPVPYGSDYARVEQIMLQAARRHTEDLSQIGRAALDELRQRYDLPDTSTEPRVYCRLTDKWIELTVRFFVSDRGVRERKDLIAREILAEMTAESLKVAVGTAIVQIPDLNVRLDGAAPKPDDRPRPDV